nr:unnamed protein product [Callosobruchus chinensis]
MSRNRSANSTCINDSTTEQLISKVCATFVSQLEEKFDRKLDKIHDKLSEMSRAIGAVRSDCSGNTMKIQQLVSRIDNVEMMQKGRTIRILGITEVENENPVDTLIKFLKDYLNVSCMLSEIDTVFRVNRAIGTDSSPQPRVLLATFTSVLKKHAVMSADKAKLKGTKILIYEDLIKGTYELLRLAKKKYGPRNVWSSGGSVFVKCGDAKRRILNSEDI